MPVLLILLECLTVKGDITRTGISKRSLVIEMSGGALIIFLPVNRLRVGLRMRLLRWFAKCSFKKITVGVFFQERILGVSSKISWDVGKRRKVFKKIAS